jgi:2-(1,2-epoxy-1,2-dihydrophenyl)acetyl-CoA isomerase
VPDEALMDEAQALAERLAAGPTLGLGLTKRLIQAAATNSLDAQLDMERDLQREAGRSADYAEGVAAFLEWNEDSASQRLGMSLDHIAPARRRFR